MSWEGVGMRFAKHLMEFMIFGQNITHANWSGI